MCGRSRLRRGALVRHAADGRLGLGSTAWRCSSSGRETIRDVILFPTLQKRSSEQVRRFVRCFGAGDIERPLGYRRSLGHGRAAASFEVTIGHPETAPLPRGGAPSRGDADVVARGRACRRGHPMFRLFPVEGRPRARRCVGDATPELAVAVTDGHRGTGIGTLLMPRLASAARLARVRGGSASASARGARSRPPLRAPRLRRLSRDDGVTDAARGGLSRGLELAALVGDDVLEDVVERARGPADRGAILSIEGSRWRSSSIPSP